MGVWRRCCADVAGWAREAPYRKIQFLRISPRPRIFNRVFGPGSFHAVFRVESRLNCAAIQAKKQRETARMHTAYFHEDSILKPQARVKL